MKGNRTRWRFKEEPDTRSIEKLKNQFKMSEVTAFMLAQRGIIEKEDTYLFFNGSMKDLHDPFEMKDMNRAVERINKAIKNQEKILIYGDYDVDGVTAVTLMYSVLSNHTSSLLYYIPDRYKEGYGVSEKGILFAEENECSLIITLDCGIKATDKVELAHTKHIDVIICDHHTPGAELPNAIVLNPKRKDCTYPYKELSGCGVGFKLLQALAQNNNWEKEEIYAHLDLLAISIGADIVPLTGENRILAREGLKRINSNQYKRKGVQKIISLVNKAYPLTISDVVFTIAPRINAAGRLDDAKKAVELLLSTDENHVKKRAEEIEKLNTLRKSLDAEITEEALEKIEQDESYKNKCTTVVYKEDWHKGVIGIVASRLIEKHYRPTIVLTLSEDKKSWTGSARSIQDVNIFEILEKCSSNIEQFGGHVAAAGLTVKTENLDQFIQDFDKEVRKVIDHESLIPEQIIEKKLPLNQLFTFHDSRSEVPRLVRELKNFEPHGPENMKPLFLAENVYATSHQLIKDEHIKMSINHPGGTHPINAIFFNAKDEYEIIQEGPFDVVYSLEENTWNNRTTLQLMVRDVRRTIL